MAMRTGLMLARCVSLCQTRDHVQNELPQITGEQNVGDSECPQNKVLLGEAKERC